MFAKAYGILLAASMAVGVHGAVAATTVADVATSTTASATATATCNFEGKSSISGVKPLGTYVGAESESECWEICADEFFSPYCIAFTYTPATKTCVFREIRVGFGVEPADSGVYYWDKACWADYTLPTPATPAPGCLAANSTCGTECTSPDHDYFASFRQAAGGASTCSDMCNGASLASVCQSYILYDDTVCYFYDAPMSEIFAAGTGNHRYCYEKACLDNSGECDS